MTLFMKRSGEYELPQTTSKATLNEDFPTCISKEGIEDLLSHYMTSTVPLIQTHFLTFGKKHK